MTVRRKFIIAALCATMAIGVNAAHADALQSVKQSGTLRVAVLDAYPPWGFVGSGMKITGFDVDFAHLIGQRMGLKVTIVPTTGGNRIPYLQTGKVDLIVACLGKNAEREKVVDFTQSYAAEINGIYGPPDVKVSTPAELGGKTVGVPRGSSEDMVLTKMAPAGTNILRFEDSSGSVQAYYAGQVQLIGIGSSVVATLQQKKPTRPLVFKLALAEEPAYVGVAKGEGALLAAVNSVIAGARSDGSLDTLSKKWFGVSNSAASR
ncbi:transporter substrate-binding domain-containing protein [Ralstonia sp.]|uniref:transporter substrate-binding domain-containing protein n=1 Tax=Ralstonia sp. TaxID=54061 RepID=UPI0031DCC153